MEFLFITPSTIIIVYIPFGKFYFPSFCYSQMWSSHLVFPVIRGGEPVGKRGAARGNAAFGWAANPQAARAHELTGGFSPAAVEHVVTS